MIQLIIGEKGNGKTKVLLEKVNTDIKTAAGTVDYIDKSKRVNTLKQAVTIGRANNQISVFGWSRKNLVYCNAA